MKERCRIYAVNIREPITAEDLAFLKTRIQADSLARVSRFRRRDDFLRGLYGEALIRYGFSKRGYSDIRLGRSERGKPFCRAHPEHMFNISHSGDWVAGAFSFYGAGSVGIDIEAVDDRYESIYDTVLSPGELAFIRKIDLPHRAEAFIRMWTAKEACLKWMGEGLYRDPKQVWVEDPFSEHPSLGPFSANLWTKRFGRGYIVSVCCCGEIEETITEVSMGELLNQLKGADKTDGNTNEIYTI